MSRSSLFFLLDAFTFTVRAGVGNKFQALPGLKERPGNSTGDSLDAFSGRTPHLTPRRPRCGWVHCFVSRLESHSAPNNVSDTVRRNILSREDGMRCRRNLMSGRFSSKQKVLRMVSKESKSTPFFSQKRSPKPPTIPSLFSRNIDFFRQIFISSPLAQKRFPCTVACGTYPYDRWGCFPAIIQKDCVVEFRPVTLTTGPAPAPEFVDFAGRPITAKASPPKMTTAGLQGAQYREVHVVHCFRPTQTCFSVFVRPFFHFPQ